MNMFSYLSVWAGTVENNLADSVLILPEYSKEKQYSYKVQASMDSGGEKCLDKAVQAFHSHRENSRTVAMPECH